MAQYGEVTWDDKSQNKSKFDRDKFLVLDDGMTAIRIITERPFKYLFHKVKFDGDKNNFGRNIRCAIDNCPLCAKKDPQKAKYVVGVIVRKTGEFKFLELGTQLFNAINNLRQNIPGCENVTEYDLNIIRNSKNGAANFYQVVPSGKSPLTAKEVEMMDNIDKDWLKEYIAPISPEDVDKTIDRIAKWLEKNNAPAESPQQHQKGRRAQPMAVADSEPEQKVVGDDAFAFKVVKK